MEIILKVEKEDLEPKKSGKYEQNSDKEVIATLRDDSRNNNFFA